MNLTGKAGRVAAAWLFFFLIMVFWMSGRSHAQCTTEIGRLEANAGKLLTHFGSAVALHGDLLVVGAYREGIDQAGAVHVFRRTGPDWIEEQVLVASDGEPYDSFGDSVSVYDDVILVGAKLDDDNAQLAGSAYVFRYDGLNWSLEQKLAGMDEMGSFGYSVCAWDGVVAVGAVGEFNDAGEETGSVHVFRFDGVQWVEEAELFHPTSENAHFGSALALEDDLLVVGSMLDNVPLQDQGSAFVYRRNAGEWELEQKLVALEVSRNAFFGGSVDVCGDVLVVGAALQDTGGQPFRTGAAFVFRYVDSVWLEEWRIVGRDRKRYDFFGESVAIDGDTILVGAIRDDEAGSATLLRFVGNRWIEQTRFYPTDGHDGLNFGRAVALGDEVAVVGVYSELSPEAVYIYPDPALFETSCHVGTVDLAYRSASADVLTVNGESGDCSERRVTVATGTPVEIAMDAPPSGPESAPFALYAWLDEPDEFTASPQPFQLGTMCFPTFITGGTPGPRKVWNNAGRTELLGEPDFPSQPAPSIVLSKASGFSNPFTVTFQGFIADNGTVASKPGSVTNAIVLTVE